jgi:hypothetical protein
LLKKKPVRKSDSAKFFTFAKASCKEFVAAAAKNQYKFPGTDLGIFPGLSGMQAPNQQLAI